MRIIECYSTLPLAASGAAQSFPNASNTGFVNAPDYPGSLTAWPGGGVTSGSTYNFFDIAGIDVGSSSTHVSNVTFHGCSFHGSGASEALVKLYGDNITFDYCTFAPVSGPPTSYANGYQFAIAADGSFNTTVQQLTVTNCNVYGFGNAIMIATSTQAKPHLLRHNYLHDPRDDNGGTDHTDGIGLPENGNVAQSYVVLDNNWIGASANTNALCYATGPYDHFTVTNNYFSGFNETIVFSANIPPLAITNMTFTGNILGTDFPIIARPNRNWTTGSGNFWQNNKLRFIPGTTWTTADGWTPVLADDGKFWLPGGTPPVSTTDFSN